MSRKEMGTQISEEDEDEEEGGAALPTDTGKHFAVK